MFLSNNLKEITYYDGELLKKLKNNVHVKP
jgi:hypothetical protein